MRSPTMPGSTAKSANAKSESFDAPASRVPSPWNETGENHAETQATHPENPDRVVDALRRSFQGAVRRKAGSHAERGNEEDGQRSAAERPTTISISAYDLARRMPVNCQRASGGKKFR